MTSSRPKRRTTSSCSWPAVRCKRLGALTHERPKPLLQLGDKPLLEIILGNFLDHGFTNIYLAVNYKAEMIMDHFGDGSRWGANIKYLREEQKLGTAGALSLLPEPSVQPIVVMNGDLLTKVNLQQLLEFHQETGSMLTACVREYDFQIPFGVVKIDRNRVSSIDEKPVQRFFVNAGIYVVDPSLLSRFPRMSSSTCPA